MSSRQLKSCYDACMPLPARPPSEHSGCGRPRPRRAPAAGERQQDADRTRQRLLDAALDVFAAKGYAGARVQEIADRAGVNKQLINYYFDSKEGLYRELQRTWQRRERVFADADLPLDELAACYLHDALAEPRLLRLMAWRGLLDQADQPPAPLGEPPRQPDATNEPPGQADVPRSTAEQTGRPDQTRRAADQPGELSGSVSGSIGDLASMLTRQANGEVAADLDPASVRLAIMGAVMTPVVMPQLVRQLFGVDPSDPEFERRYAEHLRRMIRRLGSRPD